MDETQLETAERLSNTHHAAKGLDKNLTIRDLVAEVRRLQQSRIVSVTDNIQAINRAEAAEAKAARLLDKGGDLYTAAYKRAEAAEAEVARLNDVVARCDAEIAGWIDDHATVGAEALKAEAQRDTWRQLAQDAHECVRTHDLWADWVAKFDRLVAEQEG